MSDPYSLETVVNLRRRVWTTRDGCYEHYPRYCPPDCLNAGKHDPNLDGLCECHQCRTDSWIDQVHDACGDTE